MLWVFLLVLVLVALVPSVTPTCGRLEIPQDIDSYKIMDYVEDGVCSCSGCTRKCCADGFGIVATEKQCSRTVFANDSSNQMEYFQNFDYFTGFLPCKAYLLEPKSYPDDVFHIQPDGRLMFETSKIYKNVKEYCVDFVDTKGFTAFICFDSELTVDKIHKRFNEISKLLDRNFYLIVSSSCVRMFNTNSRNVKISNRCHE